MAGLITEWVKLAKAGQKLNHHFADWLKEKQLEALKQLQNIELPNRKMEHWRYADVNRLGINKSSKSERTEYSNVDDLIQIILNKTGHEILGQLPTHIKIRQISETPEMYWQELECQGDYVLNLMNLASFNYGLYVHVEANSQHEQPEIELIYDFCESGEWQYLRNYFHINADANIKIKETYRQQEHLNVVNAMFVGKKGHFDKQLDAELTDSASLITYQHVYLSADSQMKTMNWHTNGFFQHHTQDVGFHEERSKYQHGTINKSNNNSNITDIVKVNYYNKNCYSKVIHRSIASDRSQIFNNAKAIVAKGADGSEVSQDLKNILLSDDAKIFSKPELEVNTDEVIAAHGSTIGALDEQALFYLQSRGIAVGQAKDIMIESFVKEALEFNDPLTWLVRPGLNSA
ncbi:MAG: SufD family Fe-S cluster assembly protein [Proteobacteria bacterium]|nr:SufD family Fe-S cluster assembly protein [Pseudomonadota bacterium]